MPPDQGKTGFGGRVRHSNPRWAPGTSRPTLFPVGDGLLGCTSHFRHNTARWAGRRLEGAFSIRPSRFCAAGSQGGDSVFGEYARRAAARGTGPGCCPGRDQPPTGADLSALVFVFFTTKSAPERLETFSKSHRFPVPTPLRTGAPRGHGSGRRSDPWAHRPGTQGVFRSQLLNEWTEETQNLT